MKEILIAVFVVLNLIGCDQSGSMTNSNEFNFVKLKVSDKDSVKFIGFSKRFFNNGKDSVLFGHYETDLYKNHEDSKSAIFKRESIQVLKALSKRSELPDTMYIQARGKKSEGFIKKSTDFNIYSAFDGTEWKILDDKQWKSFSDL